ncbi:MAG: hypothetical protein ABR572_12125 [Cryomorphaceae bacterium]
MIIDMKHYLAILLVFAGLGFVEAQSLDDEFDKEVRFRKNGMMVLGSWAVVNIAGGLALRTNTTGSTRYFHEMNAIWNGVNLGIATFGYIGAMRMGTPESAFGLYQEQIGMDKTLLFNAGLDLGYVAAGLWMTERAKNVDKRPDMWKGYGQAVMLQGAFLFAFDVLMLVFHDHIDVPQYMSFGIRPGAPDFLGFSLTF